MLVAITQTGGLQGATHTLGPVDTSRLDPAAANRIRRALERVDWDLPARSRVPDGETRTLLVNGDGPPRQVAWRNDGSAPDWALLVVATIETVAVWA